MSHLTKQDLLSVGIKLLALYLCLKGLNQLASFVFWVLSAKHILFSFSSARFFSMIMLLIIGALVPLLMWKCSDRLAKWAVKSNHTMAVPAKATHSLQSALFCAVGLFIFLSSLPELTRVMIQYLWVFSAWFWARPSRHYDGTSS